MKLVLIHGRDQQDKDPQELRTEWIDALKKGATNAGIDWKEPEVVMPFYGDMLDSLVNPDDAGKVIEGVVAKGIVGEDLGIYGSIITELSANAAISQADVMRHFSGSAMEKGVTNWAWVQTIIRAIDDKTSYGINVLKRFTYDVFIYLTVHGVRTRINRFVKDAICEAPCVVVAHSLGSVVGYDVLSVCDNYHVKKYITVGSPLGLRSIQSKLATPFKMPACVKNGWYNAYDERDVVALNPLNEIYFNITPAIENHNMVWNDTPNRHGITGYLNDAKLAAEILNALQS